MKLNSPWYVNWFDTPYYHILYRNRDHAEAEAFITALSHSLKLQAGAKVLDLACGKGRHSNVLAGLGYMVTGVDLSEQSINYARQHAVKGASFRVHNVLDPINFGPFDAVFNLFTSFGYFDDDELHLKVLQNVSACLQPGGLFVIDFLNAGHVRKTLVPHTIQEADGITFDISRQIEEGYVKKHIRFNHQGQLFHFTEKVRLFDYSTLSRLLNLAGLKPGISFGSYRLDEYRSDSPRMIIISSKS